MVQYPNPDDPYRATNRLDPELKAAPEPVEVPASGAKVTVLAVAIAVLLGAVFYGLNNEPVHQIGPTTAQNAAEPSLAAAPPGMRDVTPRANTEPGMTTGAAPANPKSPPATSGAMDNSSTR